MVHPHSTLQILFYKIVIPHSTPAKKFYLLANCIFQINCDQNVWLCCIYTNWIHGISTNYSPVLFTGITANMWMKTATQTATSSNIHIVGALSKTLPSEQIEQPIAPHKDRPKNVPTSSPSSSSAHEYTDFHCQLQWPPCLLWHISLCSCSLFCCQMLIPFFKLKAFSFAEFMITN